jgi:hypothetical protein
MFSQQAEDGRFQSIHFELYVQKSARPILSENFAELRKVTEPRLFGFRDHHSANFRVVSDH